MATYTKLLENDDFTRTTKTKNEIEVINKMFLDVLWELIWSTEARFGQSGN